MTVKGKFGGRKVRDGTVVSDKMQKTLLVAVEEHIRHPLYKKRIRRLHKLMAHDEREEGKMGDRVRIIEAAPVSRRKRWQLVEILQRAELPEVAAESIDLDLIGEVKREEEPTAEDAAPAAAASKPGAVEEAPAEEIAEPEASSEDVAVEEAVAAEPEAEAVAEEPEAQPEPEADAPAEDEASSEPEPDSEEASAEEAKE
jgi:small subunit ribosomal protein S17